MKTVHVNFSDYEALKRTGRAIVVFNTNQVIESKECIEVKCKDRSIITAHIVGMFVEIVRISCISGYDTDGTPLMIAECRKL